MSESLQEFRVSNDAIDEAPELRRRMDEEGYLFFRSFQNPDDLAALRMQMLEVCRKGGWVKDGTDLADGIMNLESRCTEGNPEYTDVYHEVYKLPSFHRSGHWPVVLDMMETLFDSPVIPHPQKVTRMWFPQYTAHTTPIHQDFVHFQGAYETLTCWTPLSDCPVELGGLAILPRSHKINTVREHHFSLGAGSLAILESELEDGWVTTNYELGDTLIFTSLTVHRALPNLTPDRLRLSLDNRYSAVNQPIAEQMLTPHLSNHTEFKWDDVYADWEGDEDLKFYWHKYDLDVVPYDDRWSAWGFKEALSRARDGDEAALFYLDRTIKREGDTAHADEARQVLKEYGQVVTAASL